ncbi:hypothetical protein C8R43DRAFT_1193502 [Mycena crocata]|nr:hypothetical protein C8R43DRAFT_1193502 [Mycena crocata]
MTTASRKVSRRKGSHPRPEMAQWASKKVAAHFARDGMLDGPATSGSRSRKTLFDTRQRTHLKSTLRRAMALAPEKRMCGRGSDKGGDPLAQSLYTLHRAIEQWPCEHRGDERRPTALIEIQYVDNVRIERRRIRQCSPGVERGAFERYAPDWSASATAKGSEWPSDAIFRVLQTAAGSDNLSHGALIPAGGGRMAALLSVNFEGSVVIVFNFIPLQATLTSRSGKVEVYVRPTCTTALILVATSNPLKLFPCPSVEVPAS